MGPERPGRPERSCDVVMKGGITSGIVYPEAIHELSRDYRFRSIGGTSAGAIAAAATAAAVAAWGARRPVKSETAKAEPRNPLQLRAALQMAVIFQIVLMMVHATRSFWGQAGVLTSAALLGLTDVDALTMSMSRSVGPEFTSALAALAIAVGVFSNTVMKFGLAVVLGNGRYRRIAGGALALMIAAAGAAIVIADTGRSALGAWR